MHKYKLSNVRLGHDSLATFQKLVANSFFRAMKPHPRLQYPLDLSILSSSITDQAGPRLSVQKF